MSWTGCASGTDANRFLLHINVTCPDWMKHNVTVTLRADVLKNSNGALDVINVDDEAVGLIKGWVLCCALLCSAVLHEGEHRVCAATSSKASNSSRALRSCG